IQFFSYKFVTNLFRMINFYKNCFKFLLIFQPTVLTTPKMDFQTQDWLVKEDGIFKHIAHEDVYEEGPNGGRSLHDIFIQSVKNNPTKDFLGTVDPEMECVNYITYLQSYNKVMKMADFLQREGVENRDIVGILSLNREEWFISEQAILRLKSISCPLFHSYGPEALKYILEQTELETLFIDIPRFPLLNQTLELMNNNSHLKRIIYFGKLENESLSQEFKNSKIALFSYDEIIKKSVVPELLLEDVPNIRLQSNDVTLLSDFIQNKSKNLYDETTEEQNLLLEDEELTLSKDKNKGSDIINTNLNESNTNLYEKESNTNLYEKESNMNDKNILNTNMNEKKSNMNNKRRTSKSFDKELDDVITICYTSGTSGKPKGVLLTDSNFIALITGFSCGIGGKPLLPLGENFVYFSYLPLAHSMEKIIFYICISISGKIGFCLNARTRLSEDMAIIRPKLLPGVPLVFEKIKEKIETEVKKKSFLTQWFFNMALDYKIKSQRNYPGQKLSSYFLDLLAFNQIRKKFGNNLDFALSGSAAIKQEVVEFFQAVFSIRIYQGYGQSESLAANTLQTPQSTSNSGVGIPIPSVMVKFVEFDKNDPRREICLKGQCVFKGYFRDPEQTAEVLKDGWLHTGDMGYFDDNELKINGRIKRTFKLKNGEFIAPEQIEILYKFDDFYCTMVDTTNDGSHAILIGFTTEQNINEEIVQNSFKKQTKKLLENKRLTKHSQPVWLIIVKTKQTFEQSEHLTPTGKPMTWKIKRDYGELINRLNEQQQIY
ncbi:Long-chain acyl-CoA synthetases (AMP-forming), partial [Pseudoloma neurophilia]